MQQVLCAVDKDCWKEFSEQDRSDVETWASEAESSNSEVDLEESHEQTDFEWVDIDFHGLWSKGSIHDGLLTWHEGHWDAPSRSICVVVKSTTEFQVNYDGQTHQADLRDDGKLYWDDGAIWTRANAQFEGNWTKACISKSKLTWNEGDDVAISTLSPTTFRMIYFGKVYLAELRKDRKLHWDDGDVWYRASDSAKHLEAKLPPWLSYRRRFKNQLTACFQDANVDGKDLKHANKSACSTESDDQVEQSKGLDKKASYRQHCASTKDLGPVQAATAIISASHNNAQGERTTSNSYQKSTVTIAHTVDAVYSDDRSTARSKTSVPSVPTSTKRYQGIIKWFRGSYGWLVCDTVATDYPGCDVMVHKSDCNFKPKLGDQVCFCLALNAQGNPQAVSVKMQSEHIINARDWFKANASERSKMLACK
jgi:hypothetical protein